jgi:hypothetical protein
MPHVRLHSWTLIPQYSMMQTSLPNHFFEGTTWMREHERVFGNIL